MESTICESYGGPTKHTEDELRIHADMLEEWHQYEYWNAELQYEAKLHLRFD